MTLLGGKRKSRRSSRRSSSKRRRSKRSKSRGRRSALELSRAITQQGMPEHLKSVEGAPSVAMDKLFKEYTPVSPDARSLIQSGKHPLQSHLGADLDPYLKELMDETNKLVEIASIGKQEAKEYSYPPPEQKGGSLMGYPPMLDPYNLGFGMGMSGFPMGLTHSKTSVLSPAKTMEEARRMRSYEISKNDMNDALNAKKPEYYLLEDERGVDPYKQYLTVMYDTAPTTTTTKAPPPQVPVAPPKAPVAPPKAPVAPPKAPVAPTTSKFTAEQLKVINDTYTEVASGKSVDVAFNEVKKSVDEKTKDREVESLKNKDNKLKEVLDDSNLPEEVKKIFVIYYKTKLLEIPKEIKYAKIKSNLPDNVEKNFLHFLNVINLK